MPTDSSQTTGWDEVFVNSACRAGRAHTFLFCAVFASAFTAYALWSRLSECSVSCAAAYNQILGLQVLRSIRLGLTSGDFTHIFGNNPPLYYLQEALAFFLSGTTARITAVSNSAGLFLLSYSTYRIALRSLAPTPSILAGGLALILPMVAWSNHESIVDIALAGWVACSILLLIKTEGLQSKRFSTLLGVAGAAGMLTMWTYLPIMLFPALWILIKTPNRRRAFENCMDCGIVALLGTLWWYLPNARGLFGLASITESAGMFQRDPTLYRPIEWSYDLPNMLCWCFTVILSFLVAWSLIRRCADFKRLPLSIQLALLWLAGALLTWPLHVSSNPGYLVQAAAPLGILLVYPWRESPRAMIATAVAGIVLVVLVMAPMPVAPGKLAILAPERVDWGYKQILSTLPDGALVGFVPLLPRFHAAGLQLAALRSGRQLNVYQLSCASASTENAALMTHIVTKSESPGSPCRTNLNVETAREMMMDRWVSRRLALPDGTWAEVWANPAPLAIKAEELERWQGRLDYMLLRARLARLMKKIVPENDTALVVCKGDDDLIRLLGSNFQHFPQSEDGKYAGYYPANGREATADLERLASRGVAYIVFPQTSLWWLDYYSELKSFLDAHSEIVFKNDKLAFVFHLNTSRSNDGAVLSKRRGSANPPNPVRPSHQQE